MLFHFFGSLPLFRSVFGRATKDRAVRPGSQWADEGRDLGALDFVARGENVLLRGPPVASERSKRTVGAK